MRVFVGLPVPETTRTALSQALEALPPLSPEPLTPPGNWHVTLFFIGDVTESAVVIIKEALSETPLVAPFRLLLTKLDAFDGPDKARVLYANLEGQIAPLRAMQRTIQAIMVSLGYKADERPYYPHLTLARFKSPQKIPELLNQAPPFNISYPVDRLALYQSQATATGHAYTPLMSIRL